ncbi:ribosome silencing factor [Persicirhabdus sediminis]|uniref:Ribosomal silencing factor RsfS n=1 Tax=Persicirhabdus sediminis TaxID=454144 RepID=A0A8J7MCS9_9BACT|nr:ribosome silencing factor [Persicirhabdus sediminis]MBK1790132.1 ribosome silencing factor [Persicirhabdus sediminis]
MAIEGLELALACAREADAIQAEDVKVLDVSGISTLTDYMVVCSGNSMPHLRAVIRDIEKHILEEYNSKPAFVDGQGDARWVVLDFIDVMVHVMHEEMRELYGLEDLWGDAPEVEWQTEAAAE